MQRVQSFWRSPNAAVGLAGLLVATGLSHFFIPGSYDAIVPRVLPGPARAWTLASGAAELACALALARPGTRRLGGTLAAVLFVLVFPANLQMAVDWRSRAPLEQAIAYARLPLQVPLLAWALAVRRHTRRTEGVEVDGQR